MEQRPGTPRLLRELNDRAALELLLAGGPMTRAQVGERTGLSKVTASQLLSRLEDRGLVATVGEQAGGRGPNAALYAVVPSSAYVAGLHVEHDEVSAGVADITGEVVTQVSVDPNGAANPVASATCSTWRALPLRCKRAAALPAPRIRHRQARPRPPLSCPAVRSPHRSWLWC